MKDRDQKAKALAYSVSKRWFPQLEVDVQAPHAVARKTALITDLDVFAAVPDDFVGFRHVVFDCKTLARESPVNRTLWLRGVLDRRFLREGCGYKKAGIWLTDLARPRDLQGDLFSPPTAGDDRLMATLDAINRRFGRGTVGFASSGWQHSPRWGMRQENLSQRFTTCAAELPIAVC